jgi:hypothetical protein
MKTPAEARDGAAQWTLGLVACATSLAVFSCQVRLPFSDLSQHVAFARDLCHGGDLPPHFLFELLVCGLAAPVGRARAFAVAAIVVATTAVVAKVVLTFRRLREAGGAGAAFFATLGLLFAMPLFNWWKFPEVYLGQVSPNVWHNPTTIAVLPLALLLFRAASRLTVTDPPGAVAGAGALTLLNCLTKPNYVLALLPCWLALLADRMRRGLPGVAAGWRRPALGAALLLGPTAGVLAWQASRLKAAGSAIAIDPLAVWRLYSPHLTVSILLSIAFPLGILAVYARAGAACAPSLPLNDGTFLPGGPLALAWSVLLVAVLQMAWLAEPGPRFTHGNFFWASYTANYLLFVESAAALAAAPRSRRSWAAWSLLGAHTLAGLVYVARLLAGRSFA